MTRRGAELLVLGGRETPAGRSSSVRPAIGWHHRQLIDAASRLDVTLRFADYESLRSSVGGKSETLASCDDAAGEPLGERSLADFDAILTRTMPAGSFEQITFRLATLHDETYRQRVASRCPSITNPPAGLELAIDKYATLVRASRLGIPVPETIVAQDRAAAMLAWDVLGGDVVVKPIFGGEGRGVMRVRERELAWTVFSTLQSCAATIYVQRFVPPGGVDRRVLVIGEPRYAVRRRSTGDFRTNVRGGGESELVELSDPWQSWARTICQSLGLDFAAVDFLETESETEPVLVEVNAIPGWRGAQSVIDESIAETLLSHITEGVR